MKNIHDMEAYIAIKAEKELLKLATDLAMMLMAQANINSELRDMSWCFDGYECNSNKESVREWVLEQFDLFPLHAPENIQMLIYRFRSHLVERDPRYWY